MRSSPSSANKAGRSTKDRLPSSSTIRMDANSPMGRKLGFDTNMAVSPLAQYEPLLDHNLQDHYQNPAVLKHLQKAGLIDEKGQLVDKKTLKAREIKEAREAREKQLKEEEEKRIFNREINVLYRTHSNDAGSPKVLMTPTPSTHAPSMNKYPATMRQTVLLYSQASTPFVKAEQLSLDRLRRLSKKKLSDMGLSKSSVKREYKRAMAPSSNPSQNNAGPSRSPSDEHNGTTTQQPPRPKPTPVRTSKDPVTSLFQVARSEYLSNDLESSEKHLKEILEVIHQKTSPGLSSPEKARPETAKPSASRTTKIETRSKAAAPAPQKSPIDFNKEKRFNYFNKVAITKEKAPAAYINPAPTPISNVRKEKKVSAPPPKVQVRPKTANPSSSSSGVATIAEDEDLPESSGKVAVLVQNIEKSIHTQKPTVNTSTSLPQNRRHSAKSVRPKTAKKPVTRRSADTANVATSPIAKTIQLELYKTQETVSVAKVHNDKFEVVDEESERQVGLVALGEKETPTSDISPRVSDFSESDSPLVEPVSETEGIEKLQQINAASEEKQYSSHPKEEIGTTDSDAQETVTRLDSTLPAKEEELAHTTDENEPLPANEGENAPLTTTEEPEPLPPTEPLPEITPAPLPPAEALPLPDEKQEAQRKSAELLLQRLDSKQDIETLAFELMSMENGLDLIPPMSGQNSNVGDQLSRQVTAAEVQSAQVGTEETQPAPEKTEEFQSAPVEAQVVEKVETSATATDESDQAVDALQSSSGFTPGEPLLEEDSEYNDEEEVKPSRLAFSAPASLKSSRADLGSVPSVAVKKTGSQPPALSNPAASSSTRSSRTSFFSLKSAIKKGPAWHSDAQLVSPRRVHFPTPDTVPKMFKSERQLEKRKKKWAIFRRHKSPDDGQS